MPDVPRATAWQLEVLDLAFRLADGGRPQETLDWLERTYERRDPALPYQIDTYQPDEVRVDPRFDAFFERMGLPRRD